MSDITKEVKCTTCGSYIHDTGRCNVWQNKIYCLTVKLFKRDCHCEHCRNRCQYCNTYTFLNGKCSSGHNGDRCTECNEILSYGECSWDHTKSLCQFCNLPIWKSTGMCVNYHQEIDPICSECNMPEWPIYKHKHDGLKCKICNSLLNHGNCIYKCIDGGNICIYCNSESVVNNYCWFCQKDNSGQFTKKAVK